MISFPSPGVGVFCIELFSLVSNIAEFDNKRWLCCNDDNKSHELNLTVRIGRHCLV